MNKYIVSPTSALQGEIQVPGDKSISHRALMLAALAEGQSTLDGFLMGADTLATLRAFQEMGVSIAIDPDQRVRVQGVGLHGLKQPAATLDLGNSGTAIRLLTGLLAGQAFDTSLTGDVSLCRRPMHRIVTPLQKMGASVVATDVGTPPLHITRSALSAIHYTLPMPSAQVKSCILLAGLYAQGQTSVTECGITRDHTERLLQHFRYPIERKADTVYLKGGGKLYATQVSIPGDLSSAAFFLVAASIIPGSYLTLRQVGINPTRTGIIHLLKEMGADITVHAVADAPESIADITVRYAALRGITIAPEWVPLAIDELPILLIAAACAKGVTTLRGAAELRVKESDRIEAMVQGLQRLGIRAQALPDGAMVEGGHFQGGEVDSYDDHRIAMSFAVAASVAQDSVTIRGCDHVGTSFPNFVALGNTAGMRITVYG